VKDFVYWSFVIFCACLVILDSCLCSMAVSEVDVEGRQPPLSLGLAYLSYSILGVLGMIEALDKSPTHGGLAVALATVLTLITVSRAQQNGK
jgi:hypothetical protein